MTDGMRILLVEDNPGDADLIREMFADSGDGNAGIECVPRLEQALERAGSGKFGLILLDLGLPDSWGIGTVQAVRHTAPALPIVVMTGNQDEQTGLAAIQEGAQDYLVKGQFGKSLLMRSLRYAVERKRAESELVSAKEEWERTFDAVPELIAIIDIDRFILRANMPLAVRLGTTPDKLVRCKCHEVFHGLKSPPAFCPYTKMLASGKEESIEIQEPRLSGIFDVRTTPLRDNAGELVACVHVARDITVEKQAESERERMEMQLRQSQKMEAVGQLAGGVAHDFNNMLSVINGYSEMLLEEIPPSDPMCDNVLEIKKAGERSANLTRQLLAFARRQAISPRALDLNETITGMLKMLQRIIGENIRLEWTPTPGLWTVRMDPSQLDQILANLLVNARDAISGVGKVEIRISNIELDEVYCRTRHDSAPGKYVLLEFRDNGCGMGKETLEHIFEPFFTTKKAGEGTGLGLATVFGNVKQNNGMIEVSSEPGKGTAFKIYFPRHERTAGDGDEEGDLGSLDGGSETVLLVEDEKSLLRMVASMLMKQGYRVLAASSPNQAVRLAKEHGREISILVSDVVMPEMNGRALGDKVRELCPRAKCLFMSGYPAEVMGDGGILAGDVNFIEKPFSAEKLSRKIRSVLSQEQ